MAAGIPMTIHALHGNFGMPGDWDAVLKDVPFPATAWHLWRTRREWPESQGLTSWADRFTETATADGGGKPVLAGYSLGGRLALHALTGHPGKWRAGVILSAHPGLPAEDAVDRLEADTRLAARVSTAPWETVLEEWNRQPVLVSGAPPGPQAGEEWREEISSALRDWSTGAQEDLLPAIRAAGVPILWLTGARDAKFTGLAEAAAAVCPEIVHRVVEDAGHRLLSDAPGAVAAAVTDFLAGLPSPR